MNETILLTLVASRWINFSATLFLFGAALFPFYAFAPAADPHPVVAARMRVAIIAAALAAVVSAFCWASAAIANHADNWREISDPDALSGFFLQPSFGAAWAARLSLFALLTALLVAEKEPLFAPTGWTAALAMLSAALLASQAWVGHATALAGADRWMAILAYALHVLGAGVWIGALQPLWLMLEQAQSSGGAAKSQAIFALRRFSMVGLAAVTLLVLGGLAGAAPQIHSWRGLLGSIWGWTLAVKATLFLGMIGLAAMNRFVLLPNLDGDGETVLATLRHNVTLEQAGGMLAVAAAALLGLLPPPS